MADLTVTVSPHSLDLHIGSEWVSQLAFIPCDTYCTWLATKTAVQAAV